MAFEEGSPVRFDLDRSYGMVAAPIKKDMSTNKIKKLKNTDHKQLMKKKNWLMHSLVIAALSMIGTASAHSSTTPERIPSFGPNGTHWPDLLDTPFLYDTAANEIEVECSWEAIGAAIDSIDGSEATAGVRILVQPGTLTGTGSSVGSSSVLLDRGDNTWTKRITVTPRDGYGTVTISGGFKMTRVHNVAWAGFYCTSGFAFYNCDNGAFAWSRVNGYSTLTSKDSGSTMSDFELVEIVWVAAKTDNADVLQLASNSGAITGFKFQGLWMPPHYYVNDTSPRPHTDTLQVYRANGGTYNNFDLTLEDSVIFGSNNAAIQTGGMDGLIINNSIVIGSQLGKTVYPVTPGGETSESFFPINGAGQNWEITDSYFFGSFALSNPGGGYSNQPFVTVTDSTWSGTPSGLSVPQSGSWTQDTTGSNYTDLLGANPTDGSLETLWADSKKVSRVIMSPSGGLYNSPQSVTLSTSTSGALIYYTTDGSEPGTDDNLYSNAIQLTSTMKIRAVAMMDGVPDSNIVSSTYVLGEGYLSSESWTNIPLNAQPNNFKILFDITPGAADIDGVTGLGFGSAMDFSDLACIIRFAPNGIIDVRNGGIYEADSVINYQFGVPYTVAMDINLSAKTYSVTVTSYGETPIRVATDYAFRSEQNHIGVIDTLAFVTLGGDAHTVSAIDLLWTTTAPDPPQGLGFVLVEP